MAFKLDFNTDLNKYDDYPEIILPRSALYNQSMVRSIAGANGIWITGLDGIIRRINEYHQHLSANPQKLYDKVGWRIHSWIMKNFDAEGAERAWKPLTPGTIFANKTLGRGTGKILEGKGKLRQSFTVKASAKEIRVGSPLKEAVYAEKGTGLYWIDAKKKDYLAFPWQGQRNPMSGHVPSKARVKHMWRSNIKSPKALPMQKARATKKEFGQTPFGFFKIVRHGAIAPRKILPSPSMTRALANEAIMKYLAENLEFME